MRERQPETRRRLLVAEETHHRVGRRRWREISRPRDPAGCSRRCRCRPECRSPAVRGRASSRDRRRRPRSASSRSVSLTGMPLLRASDTVIEVSELLWHETQPDFCRNTSSALLQQRQAPRDRRTCGAGGRSTSARDRTRIPFDGAGFLEELRRSAYSRPLRVSQRRIAGRALRVDVDPLGDEQLHQVSTGTISDAACEHQRRAPLRIARVDVGAALEQHRGRRAPARRRRSAQHRLGQSSGRLQRLQHRLDAALCTARACRDRAPAKPAPATSAPRSTSSWNVASSPM